MYVYLPPHPTRNGQDVTQGQVGVNSEFFFFWLPTKTKEAILSDYLSVVREVKIWIHAFSIGIINEGHTKSIDKVPELNPSKKFLSVEGIFKEFRSRQL